MRAHQIMTRPVISILATQTIAEAARLMLENRISGLPVVDEQDRLVGLISEGDLLRRKEINTRSEHSRWLTFFFGPGRLAEEYVHEESKVIRDVMTADPITVTEETSLQAIVGLMEKKSIKRVPVVSAGRVVGIVTRANLLQALASLSRNIPDPTADDDHIRRRVHDAIYREPWSPTGLNVIVKGGVVDISGIISDDRQREAAVVAARNVTGVREVHDHLCWIDTMTGTVIDGEGEQLSKAS